MIERQMEEQKATILVFGLVDIVIIRKMIQLACDLRHIPRYGLCGWNE